MTGEVAQGWAERFGLATAPLIRSVVNDEAIMPVKVEMMMMAANIHTSATSLPAGVTGALSPRTVFASGCRSCRSGPRGGTRR